MAKIRKRSYGKNGFNPHLDNDSLLKLKKDYESYSDQQRQIIKALETTAKALDIPIQLINKQYRKLISIEKNLNEA